MSNICWVLYRTTQLREDLKVANTIKAMEVKLPVIRDIWSEFQNDLIKRMEQNES